MGWDVATSRTMEMWARMGSGRWAAKGSGSPARAHLMHHKVGLGRRADPT